MTPEQGIAQLQKQFRSALLRVPVIVGAEAVNFSLDNFRAQGFLGNTFEKWPQRKKSWVKDKRPNRALLVDTGKLKRSIRVVRATPNEVVIGSDVAYARAHNEGLRIGLIQSVKGFTRKSGVGVSAHTRRVNQNIPRRRFMGNSPYLDARLKRAVTLQLAKEIKLQP